MIFDDQAGLVIQVECLLWIEKCESQPEPMSCIRYHLIHGQGESVRGYQTREERDQVFQACTEMILAHDRRSEEWGAFNREMIRKGLLKMEAAQEKEDRGW